MKRSSRRLRVAGAGLVIISLAGSLSGCGGHPIARELAGRWLGESVEQVDDEALAAATGWVKGTSMEFAGSTLTVSIPAEEPRSGEFRVVRVNKSDVKLAVTRPQGGVDHLALKLDDERSMRWMIGDGRAIVMRREY
jgi:hypothetical protein